MMKNLEYYSDRFQPRKKKVHMLPLWFATSPEIANTICNSGFGAVPLEEDGIFGRGIYLMDSAEHAILNSTQVEEKQVLIMCWVVLGNIYPVVKDDISKLRGRAKYKNYDCHYVPVVPTSPINLHESSYEPCDEGQIQFFSQYVIFNEAQLLPRFILHLEQKPGFSPAYSSSPIPVSPLMNRPTKRDVMTWSYQEVIDWMNTLNLAHDYSKMVVEHGLDGEILLELTSKEDWQEFNVVAMGDIRKLVKHTKELSAR